MKKNSIHTFVVLAYKESRYLEDCIKSVMNQEYKSNVVIATTTDNDYIRSIAKKYNLEVIVGKHTSIGGDFNYAISVGKTDLVTVAHQDDVYDKNYSKLIVDAYQKNNNASIIFTNYYEIKNSENVYKNTNINIKKLLLWPIVLNKKLKTKLFKRLIICFGNSICCPAVTYVKSNCPKEVYPVGMKSNVDWAAWEGLSKIKKDFVYVNKQAMGHRIHNESTTSEIINDNSRSKEDLEIFMMFWPKWIAKFINHFYKNSEKGNK